MQIALTALATLIFLSLLKFLVKSREKYMPLSFGYLIPQEMPAVVQPSFDERESSGPYDEGTYAQTQQVSFPTFKSSIAPVWAEIYHWCTY